jgi:hypothetical protein
MEGAAIVRKILDLLEQHVGEKSSSSRPGRGYLLHGFTLFLQDQGPFSG